MKKLGHLPTMELLLMVHKSGKLTSLGWWLNSHYLQGLTYIPGGCWGFLPSTVGHFPLNHRAMGERLEFAWSKCLEKMNQNIFSQIGGLMVMNPMVQSLKNHQLNK